MQTFHLRKRCKEKFVILLIFIIVLFITCAIRIRPMGWDRTHLNLDLRQAPNVTSILHQLSKKISSLPVQDLFYSQNKQRQLYNGCAPHPTFTDIRVHNDLWQEFESHNISFYIFGAYYDNRSRVTWKQPLVRVLAMANVIKRSHSEYPQTFCQYRFSHQRKPVIVPVQRVRSIWLFEWCNETAYNYPHLLDCVVPPSHRHWIPKTVSLVAQACDRASNNIRVVFNKLNENEPRHEFAVCMKPVHFPYTDVSHRLVEFIEVQRNLGASKIIMYNHAVHPNITKVLKYYERLQVVDFHQFTLSSKTSNLLEFQYLNRISHRMSHRLHEIIAYNDCLYRNMYRYEYLALVDMDEILMPLDPFESWSQLMQYAQTLHTRKCQGYASFCFRCTYFPPRLGNLDYTSDIPAYFHMLQHVERVRQHVKPEYATKCFHRCDSVITSHNHYPMHWAEDVCSAYVFNDDVAHMHHYRQPQYGLNVTDTVMDKSMWRFKDVIMQRSMKVFKELGFL